MKMKTPGSITPIETIQGRILFIRGQKVILDADLAALYGVPTKRLNEQIKRNRNRFPSDFMFQLTVQEAREVGHVKPQPTILKRDRNLRSQIATASKRNVRYQPYVFTEHGALQDLYEKIKALLAPTGKTDAVGFRFSGAGTGKISG